MVEDGCEVVGSDDAGESQSMAGLSDPDSWSFTGRGVVLLGTVGDHRGVVVADSGGELADAQQGDGQTGQPT